MQNDLLYDVGMNNGDDTAYYLAQGYRVVAIEADPTLAEAGRNRFADEISDGRLTIIAAAIGAEEGEKSFWLSSKPEFNSFDRSNAVKWNNTASETTVQCRPLGHVFAEYGTPYYLKVDIEGADRYCLEAIDPGDPPAYVSFEKWRLDDLLLMRSLGYCRFKLIYQETQTQLHYCAAAWSRARHRIANLKGRFRKRLARGNANSTRPFAYGSSGPFGEKTDGPWRTMEEVAFSWLGYDLGHTGHPDRVFNDWYDVHCAR